MPVPETRLSLVARLKDAGDAEAWERFSTEYEPFLMTLFRSRGLQEADARDVVQQVLIAVASRVGDWKPDGQPASFRRWLTTIARHAAIRCLMQQSRRPQLDATTILEALPVGSDSEAAVREYRQQALAWALEQIRDEFRPATWSAFWRTAVLGQGVDETCRELGLSAGALYMARSRIMARLREQTRRFDPEEDDSDSKRVGYERQD